MTTIWLGLSGLALVYVSDCVGCVMLSVPVIRSTSVPPYASGGCHCIEKLRKAPKDEGEPPPASPQAIMMSPARKFSCLSIPRSRNRGTVKSRRKACDVDNFVRLLRLCGAGSKP